jgi:hypothetical protein
MEESEALQALLRLFETVEQWAARTGEYPADVQPGSRLAGDDDVLRPFHMSHAAQSALVQAVDHLHCLRSAVVEAKTLHTYAPFTLVRGALENASTAVWLLQPDVNETRHGRRLQLAMKDAEYRRQVDDLVSTASAAEEGKLYEARREQYLLAADRAGVARTRLTRAPGFERIVREAGEATVIGSEIPLVMWKACSGIAHGQMWAGLSMLTREQVEVAVEVDVFDVKFSAPARGILQAVWVACQVLETGWQMYDHQRLRWREYGKAAE